MTKTMLDQILAAPDNKTVQAVELAPIYQLLPAQDGQLVMVMGTVPPGTDLTPNTNGEVRPKVTVRALSATKFSSHVHAMHFISEFLGCVEKTWPEEAAALAAAGKAAGAL